MKNTSKETVYPPGLSRGIGAGAMDVADFLSEITGYRVIDKEIMDHITQEHQVAHIIACAFEQKFQVNFKHEK